MSDEGGGRYVDLKSATYLAQRLGQPIGFGQQAEESSPKKKGVADDPGGGDVENQLVEFHKVPKKKEMSRAEKEKLFIVENIKRRLVDLVPESAYDVKKGVCGVVAFLFLIAGGVLVLKSLGLTVIFASDPFNFTLLVVGCSFALPCFVWFVYIFILPNLCCGPCLDLREHRTFIHGKRKERKNPGLFNQMVGKANQHSEPPIIRTRLFAMYRKKEYTIVSHQMREFQDMFYFKTGLAPDRQVFKLRDLDGSSEIFKFSPDDYVLDLAPRGVKKDTVFWIYGTGGFEHDIVKSPDNRMRVPKQRDEFSIDETLMDSVEIFRKDLHIKDEVDLEIDNMLAAGILDSSGREMTPKTPQKQEEFRPERAFTPGGSPTRGIVTPRISTKKKKKAIALVNPYEEASQSNSNYMLRDIDNAEKGEEKDPEAEEVVAIEDHVDDEYLRELAHIKAAKKQRRWEEAEQLRILKEEEAAVVEAARRKKLLGGAGI